MEIIGILARKDHELAHDIFLEFPQQLRWWRTQESGLSYEFIPYMFGSNLTPTVPINKDFIITMVAANVDVVRQYRKMIDTLLTNVERMTSLKASIDETGEGRGIVSVTRKP